MCLHSGVYCHLHFFLADFVVSGEDVAVVVRADHFANVAGADLFAADDDGYVYYSVPLALKLLVKRYALGGACQVGFYRLVCRGRERNDGVVH